MGLKSSLHQLKEKYKGTKMAPAFNALHTFLYMPNETTKHGTHIKAADDLKRTMNIVIMALVPCLIFGMFNAGFQHYAALGTPVDFLSWDAFWIGIIKVLPLVAVSYGVGLAIEFLFAIIKGHEVEEGYLVTGMLVPLIVPVDLPLWMLAVAVSFGVVIGKEVFGGTGMNILNPALTIRAFLFFAYPTWMSGDKVWVHGAVERAGTADAISGETILGSYAQNADISYSLSDMFFGFIPGSVGETSKLLIIFGALFLIFTKIGSWRIILSTIVGALVM
jgi:Na+-transporting NADH:ubiquinone oxidoreductase subunit B